jgi:hypothetical protein
MIIDKLLAHVTGGDEVKFSGKNVKALILTR